MSLITEQVITSFKERLEHHPIYEAINSVERLRCFMEHHVYSVLDFMSLVKYLQNAVAPSTYPWLPVGDTDVKRFINELVLEEESDQVMPGSDAETKYISHFELYCAAMNEIGADTKHILDFVERLKIQDTTAALNHNDIPAPSRQFTQQTFAFIDSDQPHQVAAALALGREHIIPCMFKKLLQNLGVSEKDAPSFHYYLTRHIHLDEGFHAPLSLRLLNSLCKDEQTQKQAINAAEVAVATRLKFWDELLEKINSL